LARSAADLQAALLALGGPDADDAVAYRWSLPAARHQRLADYRIGYVFHHELCPVSHELRTLLDATTSALEKAGAKVEEGWPAGVSPAEQYDTWLYLFYSFFRAPQMRDEDEPQLRERAAVQDGSYEAKKAFALTAPHKQFIAASNRRMVARAIWQDFFRTHDVFLMPTAFDVAPPHDHSPAAQRQFPTSQGNRPYSDLYFWTSFATLAGLPATVAPVGQTKQGLPVGIQIIGPYLEDATPIDFAARLAEIIGGFQKPPAS